MVFVINLSPRSLSRSKSARYPAAMTSMALFSVSSLVTSACSCLTWALRASKSTGWSPLGERLCSGLCWISARSALTHAVPSLPVCRGTADAAWRDQQRDSDLQKASAPQDKADDAVAAEPPAAPQVTPSVQQSSESLVPHSVPTIAYRVLPPSAQTVSGPTAVAARTAEPMPAGASKSKVVVLSGAATAAGLLFAGGVFHFTRRGQLRTQAHCGRSVTA